MQPAVLPLRATLRPSLGWILPLVALVCLWPAVSPAYALAAGAVLGWIGANAHPARTAVVARWLLQLSIVALGATMPLMQVARAGMNGLGVTAISILATLALGRWLGRALRVNPDTALLVSGGTAICGGSAIAAIAGALRPKTHDVTISLATVFLLNGVALLIFPPIGHLVGLTQRQFGWWAALAIHDTSSVVGAGLAYGSAALAIATTVKLARALWIAPLTVGLAFRRRHGAHETEVSRRAHFPWFIVGFVAVAGVFTLWPALSSAAPVVGFVAQRMLVLTLFCIGAGFTREALRAVGLRPLVLGIVLWVIVGTTSLIAIKAGLIG